jgi:hypothetical protein
MKHDEGLRPKPKHEPEVLAVRRRKPLGNRAAQSQQQLNERRPYSAYWLLKALIAWGRSLLRPRS